MRTSKLIQQSCTIQNQYTGISCVVIHQQWTLRKRHQENSLTYRSTRKSKMSRNKSNQGGKRPVVGKDWWKDCRSLVSPKSDEVHQQVRVRETLQFKSKVPAFLGAVSLCFIKAFSWLTSLVAQMGKASAYNAGDLGSIPGLGRFPGEGNGDPLQ